ncbi:MAG: PIN domain-containing protein [Desulfobacterales bacterium]|nr:PIN domain-containing protein [Desulfobacterales bacterium]
MVLVDTSVWVNHFRRGEPHLDKLLMDADVVCHSFIIGELACGNIVNRTEILTLLRSLPLAPAINLDEYLYFVERNQLHGIGIGFVDVHLLASAKLAGVPLWTNDKKLHHAASNMGLSYSTD